MTNQPVPLDVVVEVDMWITARHDLTARYDNVEPLDDGGADDLHRLVGAVYARGWADGAAVADHHARARGGRRHDRERREADRAAAAELSELNEATP